MQSDRRHFLLAASGLGITALSVDAGRVAAAETERDSTQAPVSASEDLMREHGVLNRILLVYEEGLRRMAAREHVAPGVFHTSASLVRKFVEDYHEALEEKFIFPEFERRGTLVELVRTLRQQHKVGRKLTDTILRDSEPKRFDGKDSHQELVLTCEAFIRMYRPHEAHEDTVLFPSLHALLSAEQLDELGEQFEEQEDRLFGEGGFHRTVQQVAAIEKQLGIYELSQFTPDVSK
jgi:hemerythrin-like domain-containing protein